MNKHCAFVDDGVISAEAVSSGCSTLCKHCDFFFNFVEFDLVN